MSVPTNSADISQHGQNFVLQRQQSHGTVVRRNSTNDWRVWFRHVYLKIYTSMSKMLLSRNHGQNRIMVDTKAQSPWMVSFTLYNHWNTIYLCLEQMFFHMSKQPFFRKVIQAHEILQTKEYRSVRLVSIYRLFGTFPIAKSVSSLLKKSLILFLRVK